MQAARIPGPLRHVLARIRLSGSFAIGCLAYFVLPGHLDRSSRLLIGWNIAIVTFLVLVGFMMARSTHESMRKRAQALDEGRYMVLILAMVAAVSSLAAIVFELVNLKDAPGSVAALHVALSVATILTSWSFVHVIFTEHYAHGFYRDLGTDGGEAGESEAGENEDGENEAGENKDRARDLRFPGQPLPDYLDFLYFSFTIGVANQTADTEILSRHMRVLVLIHSVISYFFNTIILALTINIAASMLGG